MTDGKIQPEEQTYLDQLYHILKLSEKERAELKPLKLDLKNYEKEIKSVSDPYLKLIILRDLILLSHSDNVYCSVEDSFISRCSELMGVSGKRFSAMKKWVEDGNRWNQKGEKLLIPEGVTK